MHICIFAIKTCYNQLTIQIYKNDRERLLTLTQTNAHIQWNIQIDKSIESHWNWNWIELKNESVDQTMQIEEVGKKREKKEMVDTLCLILREQQFSHTHTNTLVLLVTSFA